MLNTIIIVLTIFFTIFQLVISCGIVFYKVKCKNSELHMVTNLWFDYIPYLLFIYSLLFIIYSIKYSDTSVLLTVISLSIIFIFDIKILIYNNKHLTLITFPLQKEKFNSFFIQGKFVILENEKGKKLINLSSAKINKIIQSSK